LPPQATIWRTREKEAAIAFMNEMVAIDAEQSMR
jgi:hypothetical protein